MFTKQKNKVSFYLKKWHGTIVLYGTMYNGVNGYLHDVKFNKYNDFEYTV